MSLKKMTKATALMTVTFLALTGCKEELSEREKIDLYNASEETRVKTEEDGKTERTKILAGTEIEKKEIDQKTTLRTEAIKAAADVQKNFDKQKHVEKMEELDDQQTTNIIKAFEPYMGYILVSVFGSLCLFLILKFWAFRVNKEYEYKTLRQEKAYLIALEREKYKALTHSDPEEWPNKPQPRKYPPRLIEATA